MPTLYPDAVNSVLSSVALYRRREMSLDELKTAIWEAARAISSPTESDLHRFLQAAEGMLDVLQSTVDAASLNREVSRYDSLADFRISTLRSRSVPRTTVVLWPAI